VTLGAAAARAAWVRYWDLARRWHRFEVRGIERLDGERPRLIVGYHGRAMAHDLCMLQSLLRERGAREPRAIVHEGFLRAAPLRWLVEGAGFVTGDPRALAEAIGRGDSIIVTPGGTREACRSFRDRYRVEWGGRLGYLRLALAHGLPIVPVAASGVDDTFVGLNDGYAWGKRLGLPAQLPFWLALGPLGLWPLSPPWPAKIVQHVGEPIELGAIDPRDREALGRAHARVTTAVQALLDEARGTHTPEKLSREREAA